jgi:hypothetical protein
MPYFELSFEVWCGTCGRGLCNISTITNDSYKHNKGYSVTVEVCPDCTETRDHEIASLKTRIDELEGELSEALSVNGSV